MPLFSKPEICLVVPDRSFIILPNNGNPIALSVNFVSHVAMTFAVFNLVISLYKSSRPIHICAGENHGIYNVVIALNQLDNSAADVLNLTRKDIALRTPYGYIRIVHDERASTDIVELVARDGSSYTFVR
jgi:hypothetical protein